MTMVVLLAIGIMHHVLTLSSCLQADHETAIVLDQHKLKVILKYSDSLCTRVQSDFPKRSFVADSR